MAKHILTPKGVEHAKSGQKDVRYGDGGGLYLHVKPSGSKSWVLRFWLKGKVIERGLGAYPEIGLKDARDKAEEWKGEIKAGRNPRPAPVVIASTIPTFEEAAETLISVREANWKSDVHRAQWKQSLRDYAYPHIGRKTVDAVTLQDVADLLEPHWRTKHESMKGVRSRIAIVLDWSIARGFRKDNPARQLGALKDLLGTVKKPVIPHAALPHVDAPEFIGHLRKLESNSARALEFAILTGSRTSEVILAKPSEIDRDAMLWVVPAERMKAGKEHRVPLTQAALDCLDRVHPLNAVALFPAQRSWYLSSMAMLMCLRGIRDAHYPGLPLTVHGFRSTFRDWAADCTDYPHEVCEAALAHTVSNDVVRAYRRTSFFDKRRDLMNDWSAYLAGRLEVSQDDAGVETTSQNSQLNCEAAELKAQIEALQARLAALA